MEKQRIKLVEAFAGYGSQKMALKKIGIEFTEDSSIIEWTIDAIIANAAAHHYDELQAAIKDLEQQPFTKEQKINLILNSWTLSTEKKKGWIINGEYIGKGTSAHKALQKENPNFDAENGDAYYLPVDENQLKRMTEDRLNLIICANKVTNNLGSIMETKGEQIANADLFTYSFPCQDLSLAGKMAGITKTSRSGLLFQVERMLRELPFEQRPKHLVLENVKNLVGTKFKPDFDEWLLTLEELGYNTTWRVLNARNLNVPQNRERVFAVSVRNDIEHTIDVANIVEKPLEKRLKDYLEKNVAEEFYLSDEHIMNILGWNAFEKPLKKVLHADSIDVGTITTRSGEDTSSQKLVMDEVVVVGNISESGHGQGGNVYSPNGLAPTFTENHGTVMKIVEKEKYITINKDGVDRQGDRIFKEEAAIGTLVAGAPYKVMEKQDNHINVEDVLNGKHTIMGINPQGPTYQSDNTVHGENYYVSTLRAGNGTQLVAIKSEEYEAIINGESPQSDTSIIPLRIRKITPREALRLMGVEDDYITRMLEYVTSKGPQYKLAGNSIVVDVLEHIFMEIFK